jgi:glycosyltransferase involved in cell wall biosynthesis
MKVLMVNSFYYMRGGGERYTFDLSALLESNGHEVIPFSMEHPQNFPSDYADYFVSNVDFPSELAKKTPRSTANVLERILYSREAKAKMERILADTRPDLVHVNGFIHEFSTSILPPMKAAGLPVTQTLHDYKIVCPNTTFVSNDEVCEQCLGHRYYNVVRRRCKRGSLSASLLAGVEMYFHEFLNTYETNIDVFQSPSEFLRRKVIEHGVKKPVVVIPHFFDPNNFQPYYEPENYVVYVGRLVRVKGIMTLLRAMEQTPQTHLYVAGSGELEPEMRAFIAERGLTNVTLLGHLKTDELQRLVQRALANVLPSEWYENYSATLRESLACGTPVIGADIGGIPEQVTDGWNGYLFEPGNADQLAEKIRRLVENPALAVEMGRRGRRQVEIVNSPETHYRQVYDVYDSLLRGVPVSQPAPAIVEPIGAQAD